MPASEALAQWTALRRGLFYPKSDIPLDADLLVETPVDRHGSAFTLHVRELCVTMLGREPTDIEPLPRQGTFHSLYRLQFGHADSLILKASVLSPYVRDFSFHVDVWTAARLGAGRLRAARILKIDTSRSHCPFDFSLAAEAPGVPLTEREGDEAAMETSLRRLGAALSELHGIALSGFGLVDVEPLVRETGPPRGLWDSWSGYLLLNLERHVALCLDIGAVSEAEARRIESLFERSVPALDVRTGVLLHGDLGNHNIFRDSSDVTWLVDWEDALVGDPLYELAFWLTFHPARRWPAALEGYGLGWPLPQGASERFWLYFLRVALMKTVLRHRFGFADRPDRIPASQRIQLALSAIENPGGLPA